MKHLRSRTPEGIDYEVAGHVLLYLLTRWLIVDRAKEHGIEPLRISFTHALRELLDLRQALLGRIPNASRIPCCPGCEHASRNTWFPFGRDAIILARPSITGKTSIVKQPKWL
jgi:hypothetical protein